MIDLTSNGEVENDYTKHMLDKENADPNRKRPFSTFCGGVSMMPDLDSKMSPKEQQEHHKILGCLGVVLLVMLLLKRQIRFSCIRT